MKRAAVALLLLSTSLPAFGQEAPPASPEISALPPAATRSDLRGRWFEFLSALHEEDAPGARAVLTSLGHTAERVGILRLPDFSRAALAEARQAAQAGFVARARLALDAALVLDPDLVDVRSERLRFEWRAHNYRAAAAEFGGSLHSLFAAHESRRELESNLEILIGVALLAATGALVISLFVRHIRRLLHSFGERFGPLPASAAAPAAILFLGLPVWLAFGPGWLLGFWAILLFVFAERRERAFLGAMLILSGLVVPLWRYQAYENFIARSPLVMAALDLAEQKEEGGTVDLLRQASATFPEDPDVWYLLGRFAQRRDDFEEAASDYARSLQNDPKSFRTLIAIGNIHFWQGDLNEAIQTYRQAIALQPQSPIGYYNLQLALGDAYFFDEQKEALARARALAPRDIDRWIEQPTVNRGVSLDYGLDEARARSRRWSREVKSQMLPGLGHLPTVQEIFLVPPFLICWGSVLLGILLASAPGAASLASIECSRCGRTVCRRCQGAGFTGVFCKACSVLLARREPRDIVAQVLQADEIRGRERRQRRERRILSLLLPGSFRACEGETAAAIFVFLLFFLLVGASCLRAAFYPVASLAFGSTSLPAASIAATLAFLVWLGSNIRMMRS